MVLQRDFKERTITIDYILQPMRNINNLQFKPSISRALMLNSSFAQEPDSTRNATKCVVEILDAKYDKSDLPSIVKNNCAHLSTSHHNSLLALLLKFEELFDGTLRAWKLPPVSFELKEGAKPYHGRPYPIPKIHKATLMKEIDCLISIGVLKWQPSSKWASPSFIILKKDLTVRTISDFRELNKRIVRKPYKFKPSLEMSLLPYIEKYLSFTYFFCAPQLTTGADLIGSWWPGGLSSYRLLQRWYDPTKHTLPNYRPWVMLPMYGLVRFYHRAICNVCPHQSKNVPIQNKPESDLLEDILL